MTNPMIPARTYRALPVCWGLVEHNDGAKLQIEFRLCDDIDVNGENVPLKHDDGRLFTEEERIHNWFGYFSSEGAEKIAFKAMKVCGWKGEPLDALELDKESEVKLVIEHEEFKGKPQCKVSWVNSLSGGGVNAISADRAKKFAERMAARAAQYSGAPASQQSNGGNGTQGGGAKAATGQRARPF